jgi:NAD(P)H-dependent FMN reductase
MTTKILALSGSSRVESLNQRLLDVGCSGARAAGASVTTIRLADFALPLYDADIEAVSGLPAEARELQALVANHHGLLVASPEYNGGYTALLKNALDWISRALLRKSSRGRVSPDPGRTYATATVCGQPSRVKRLSSAARICNSAT